VIRLEIFIVDLLLLWEYILVAPEPRAPLITGSLTIERIKIKYND
jgi:hypothetical protein